MPPSDCEFSPRAADDLAWIRHLPGIDPQVAHKVDLIEGYYRSAADFEARARDCRHTGDYLAARLIQRVSDVFDDEVIAAAKARAEKGKRT